MLTSLAKLGSLAGVGLLLFGCIDGGDARPSDDGEDLSASTIEDNAVAPSGVHTTVTPDIAVVQYIRSYNSCAADCSTALRNDPTLFPRWIDGNQVETNCAALCGSANSEPPGSFPHFSDWDNFRSTKQYRGYIHLPSMSITCNGNALVSYNPHDPDYVDNGNPTRNPDAIPSWDANRNPYGYTNTGWPIGFSSGDVKVRDQYGHPDNYNGLSWWTNSTNSCLYVDDSRSSRLAPFERSELYYNLTHGVDAPYIFTDLRVSFCCSNTTTNVTVSRSSFPQTNVYIDGTRRVSIDQNVRGNLAAFMNAGTRGTYTHDNSGPFAPAGSYWTWSGR